MTPDRNARTAQDFTSAEEQARDDAVNAVVNAIEKCRAAGCDDEVISQLADLIRQISKNTLWYVVNHK